MNTFFRILCISVFSTAGAYADYSAPFTPLDQKARAATDDFIPSGWRAIALAQGDLNQDERTDYALVIQQIDPENIHSVGGLVAVEIDANPRHLLLVFTDTSEADHAGVGERLRRKRIYRRFIPSLNPEHPDRAEPLSYIGINTGLLEVKFESWGEAYSWERDDLTFKFRYDASSETFPLISFEQRNVHKATGMFKDVSVDLLQYEIQRAAGSMSSPKHRKSQADFIPTQDWTLCDIKQPLSFFP